MHWAVSDCTGDVKTGPGDGGLAGSWTRPSRLSIAVVKEAPHISQCDNEGWFWNVHLGHERVAPPGFEEAGASFVWSFGSGPGADLLDIAAIAAFTTCTVGGLMPQARHGGMGVREAKAGSKLTGTGLEKEQIGHTHVALVGGGAGAGLLCRGGVVEERPWGDVETPRLSCFKGFGKRVILAEDLRKPA